MKSKAIGVLGLMAVVGSASLARADVPCAFGGATWGWDGDVCGGDATIATGPDGDGAQAVGISLNHSGNWKAHICRTPGNTFGCVSTCMTFDTSDDGTSAVDATGCNSGADAMYWIDAQ